MKTILHEMSFSGHERPIIVHENVVVNIAVGRGIHP
jgi:hypothetical protein